MRDEYDRIQKKMKEDMKKPTLFDRIKNFFGRSKKGEEHTPSIGPSKLLLPFKILY